VGYVQPNLIVFFIANLFRLLHVLVLILTQGKFSRKTYQYQFIKANQHNNQWLPIK